MKCAICGIEVETIQEAIDQHWIPSFYDEMDNEHEPACCDCATIFLDYNPDGEWEVKEEFQGKMKYLDAGGTQTSQDELPIEIWVREEEPAKPN
jgi:hypothetical protein